MGASRIPCAYVWCIEGYSCTPGTLSTAPGVLRTIPSPCTVSKTTLVFREARKKLSYSERDGFCIVTEPVKAVLPGKLCDYLSRIMSGRAESKVFLGPGGTGKSLSLDIIRETAPFNIIVFDSEMLLRPYVGQSEQELYKLLAECEESEPCLLVMDEMDILLQRPGLSTRGMYSGTQEVSGNLVRILLRRLQRWYNEKRNLGIVGASNLPASMIDKTLLRAGRLGEPIYFPPPDKRALQLLAQLYGKELSEEEMREILRLGLPHSNVVEYFKTGRLQKWEPEAYMGIDYVEPAPRKRLGKVKRVVIGEPWALGEKLAALIAATELEKPLIFVKQTDRLLDAVYMSQAMQLPIAIPYDHYTASIADHLLSDHPQPVFYIGREWSLPYIRLGLKEVEQLYGAQPVYRVFCNKKKTVIPSKLLAEITRCISMEE